MWREYPTFLPEEILEYLRKSRSDDATLTVAEVLERQEAELREWQDRNLAAPIPKQNIYKEVASGESLSERPEFRKLLKRLESPKIKALLVRDFSRCGRPDLEEIGFITKLLLYNNVMVITPHRTLDLKDEWDRDTFQRELMRSNEYLNQAKTFLNFGKSRSLKEGFYINGVTPYGYERDWTFEGKRKRPTLAIVETEAQVVRKIFDWYVNEGIGATKICQRLNSMAIPSRKGIEWKKSSIVNILKNEHYLGKVVIRKHIDVNTVEDLKITKHCVFNPDYEVVDGRHPAIIDEDTFNRANNKIRRYPSVKPSSTLQNPFASILKCECGRVMIRRKSHDNNRYLCDEQMYCGNASIGEKELTKLIIKHLQENLYELTARVTDNDDKKREKHLENVSLLEAKYHEIEKKELSLWDKYAEEQMPKHIFDKLMADCKEKKLKLENALEDAYNNVPEHIDYKGAVASLKEAIDSLGDNSISASAKNKLLCSVVDKIVYKREKARRMPIEEARKNGLKLNGGWYCPPPELDIHLKI